MLAQNMQSQMSALSVSPVEANMPVEITLGLDKPMNIMGTSDYRSLANDNHEISEKPQITNDLFSKQQDKQHKPSFTNEALAFPLRGNTWRKCHAERGTSVITVQ